MRQAFHHGLVAGAFLAALLTWIGASVAGTLPGYVFVPRAAIYPGDTISEDDLVSVPLQNGKPANEVFGSRADDLVGKIARRTLLAGKPIPASAIRERAAVVQGRACGILYRAGALTISGTAVPLKSAAVGEMVSARNSETGRLVQAVVQADGTLLVTAQ